MNLQEGFDAVRFRSKELRNPHQGVVYLVAKFKVVFRGLKVLTSVSDLGLLGFRVPR